MGFLPALSVDSIDFEGGGGGGVVVVLRALEASATDTVDCITIDEAIEPSCDVCCALGGGLEVGVDEPLVILRLLFTRLQ